MAPVIDVHTHMLTHEYVAPAGTARRPDHTLKTVTGGLRAIHLHDAPFMTPVPDMFDYPARIKMMDTVGIDVSVISLSCPNVYWGGPEISLQAARLMNDDMAAARARYKGRIEYFCSLPWQHAELAVAELKRATARGASGVMVLANIDGHRSPLPQFAPVWKDSTPQRCRCSSTRPRRRASASWACTSSSSRRRSVSPSTPRSPWRA
jgi:aminocarboxymuconate-semialdehyde decarboxylase